MANALCYKNKIPTIYNQGTVWEKRHDTFCAMYVSNNDAEAQAIADELNKSKPATLPNGEPIDWTNVEYFFINKQGEMY